MARVRISKTPKALSGLEIKMRPGLYGTNGNRQFSLPNQVNSQKFSQQPIDVRDTLQPVDREGANLEAEKGETAIVNIDGIPAHFKIGGKRHSEGGTPLNLPDNSFIFSDTAKMKIKDPMVHAQFGMVPKKSGYTPAEIAKKYDINTFRKILADPNSEDVERKTAEMMITNYNMKLAKLALVQESMKGFPQGIPAVAMPYVIANEIDPAELVETQGQEEQPDADMGVARYGGIPKAQKGLTHKDSVKHQANKILKYEQLRGGPGGSPLPYYSDPKYNTMLMDDVYPEVNKIMPNASAMEKGEAMDFIFNAGWDKNSNKITKDPRAFALQEYYRKNDPSKLDADGKWAGRKGAPYSFDKEYEETIGSLPENERRIMMNKGRDWYYKNINNPSPGVPNSNYKDTWYGRIWNTNDFNEFDSKNPKFTPKRYGGNMISQFNTKQYGGLPTAQTGIQQSDDDYYWVNSEGVKFDPMTGQEIDSDELSYFDPRGITKQLGKMKQYLGHDLWKGNPNDIALPPVSGYGEAPTANALAARQMISKLNPYNVPSDGIMGVFDYLGNAINLPLSGINKLTTGKVGTTGNLYTDVLMDPLTYTGLAPAKWTAEAAIKYGPKVGSFIAKHGTKALKYLGEYGDIAVEAIKKYGQKGIDYVIEKTPELLKQAGKALTSETAQNIGTSLIARGASGASQEKKKDQKVEKLEKEIARLKSAPTTAATPTSVLLPKKAKTAAKSITKTATPEEEIDLGEFSKYEVK
jgi:hypothetical protein